MLSQIFNLFPLIQTEYIISYFYPFPHAKCLMCSYSKKFLMTNSKLGQISLGSLVQIGTNTIRLPDRAEKIEGKGENAVHQHFLFFLQCSQKPFPESGLYGYGFPWTGVYSRADGEKFILYKKSFILYKKNFKYCTRPLVLSYVKIPLYSQKKTLLSFRKVTAIFNSFYFIPT